MHEVDDASTPFHRAAPKFKKTATPTPFEIKTGRAVAGMEHRAQTMLYTLLMGERYGTEIPSGLLYYTRSEEVVRVPAARNELRALLVARNEMAGHMMSRIRAKGAVSTSDNAGDIEAISLEDLESFLPPTIDDNRICGKCYALDTCMLFRKVCRIRIVSVHPCSHAVFLGCRKRRRYDFRNRGHLCPQDGSSQCLASRILQEVGGTHLFGGEGPCPVPQGTLDNDSR